MTLFKITKKNFHFCEKFVDKKKFMSSSNFHKFDVSVLLSSSKVLDLSI